MGARIASVLLAVAVVTGPCLAGVSISPELSGGLSIYSQKVLIMGLTVEGDNKVGGVFGASVDIAPNPYFSIDPGVAFSKRGTELNISTVVSGMTVTGTGTESLNYLEIPIHFKGKFPIQKFTPYGLAGLNTGILLSARLTGTVPGENPVDQDIKDSLKTLDFGLDFGLGMEFHFFSFVPFVQITDCIGLADVVNKLIPISAGTTVPISGSNAQVEAFNHGIEIQVGVKYTFKK